MTATLLVVLGGMIVLGLLTRLWGETTESRQLRLTALLLRPDPDMEVTLEPEAEGTLLERTRMVLSAAKLARILGLFLVLPSGLLVWLHVFSPLIEAKGALGLPLYGGLFALAIMGTVVALYLVGLYRAVGDVPASNVEPPVWLVESDEPPPAGLMAGWLIWERVLAVLDGPLGAVKLSRPKAQMYEHENHIRLGVVRGNGQDSHLHRHPQEHHHKGGRTEEQMIRAIQELDHTLVREIMLPINHVTAVRLRDYTPRRFLDLCRRTGFTRIPVYEDHITSLIGYINVYDLLEEGEQPKSLRSLVTRPLFVPEVARVDYVLRQMILNRMQVAIVFDEYGGTSGWITREDILEEIIGEVADEYERPRRLIVESRGGYLIDGSVDLDDLKEELGIDLTKRHCDTISGYVYYRLGRVPRRGEVLEEKGWKIMVVSVDDHIIRRLRLVPPEPTTETGREG